MDEQMDMHTDHPMCSGCVHSGTCQSHHMTMRSEEEYKKLMNRLNRIEGQIHGIQKMVQDNRYCVDILTQCAAVTAAMNSFNKELLADHIRTCVADNIRSGNDEVLDELVRTVEKLMKD